MAKRWWAERRIVLAHVSKVVDAAAAQIELEVDELAALKPDDMVSVCIEDLGSVKAMLREIATDLGEAVNRKPTVGT